MSAVEGGVLELTTDLTLFTFAKMKQAVSCLHYAASLVAYTHLTISWVEKAIRFVESLPGLISHVFAWCEIDTTVNDFNASQFKAWIARVDFRLSSKALVPLKL